MSPTQPVIRASLATPPSTSAGFVGHARANIAAQARSAIVLALLYDVEIDQAWQTTFGRGSLETLKAAAILLGRELAAS